MGNRGARGNQAYQYGDPYLNQYGAGYGIGGQPGLAGYGAYGAYEEPGTYIEEPWEVTQWTSYYVPTVAGRQKRPVIYIAAPMPAANPCGGFGGGLPMGGGFGGGLPMGGGFGGGLPMGGGFGGGLPMGGGFGGGLPMGGGFGSNLGYQVLPMMTVAYGGGIPPASGPCGGGFGGGFGGGLPLF